MTNTTEVSGTLDILHPGWSSSRLEVIDPSTSTPLYKSQQKGTFRKYILVTRPSPKQSTVETEVGRISSAGWGSSMNIDMQGQAVTLKHRGVFSSSYEFSTSVLSGEWKHPSSTSSRMELVTAAGVVAEYRKASWTTAKKGTLNVFGNLSQAELDVVVTTVLAIIVTNDNRRRAMGASNAASNASIAGIAGSSG